MSVFLLMDEHPMSMKEHLAGLVESKGPRVSVSNVVAYVS